MDQKVSSKIPFEYCIVFEGEILPNYEAHSVKESFARRFKSSANKLEKIFSGQPMVLKKAANETSLERLRDILSQMGLLVEIQPVFARKEFTPFAREETEPPSPELELDKQERSTTEIEQLKPSYLTAMTDRFATVKKQVKGQLLAIKTLPRFRFRPDLDPERLRGLLYRYDSFIAKGGWGFLKLVALVFFALLLSIALLRGLILLIAPDAAAPVDNLGFFGHLFVTFLELTDPGSVTNELPASAWYKAMGILAGATGIILFSAFIAMLTTSLHQKIEILKRGNSDILEQDHTLILGWNEQRIVDTLRELIIANQIHRDSCVVILADTDKQAMDELIRLRVPESKSTRIVTRSGRIASLVNLERVCIDRCQSVLILTDCHDSDSEQMRLASDANVLQTVLAISSHSAVNNSLPLVAELHNDAYRRVVEESFSDNVMTVQAGEILAKILVQASRTSGLSTIYNSLLSFSGNELCFFRNNWRDITFGELAHHFRDGVPIGVATADGQLHLNPRSDSVMETDDSILILTRSNSATEINVAQIDPPDIDNNAGEWELPGNQLAPQLEKILIIGWNAKAPLILRELIYHILPGSCIDVMVRLATENQWDETAHLSQTLDFEINLIEKSSHDIDDLMSLDPFSYHSIIVLANTGNGNNPHQADSESIVTTFLLQQIFSEPPPESGLPTMVTEILDSQNLPLITRTGARDTVVSNQILSMIIAQSSKSKFIKLAYDQLFQEEGNGIYLKPPSLYFSELPVTLSFADLTALVQKREEICLGIKLNDDADSINLIPAKGQLMIIGKDDRIIVLAENGL